MIALLIVLGNWQLERRSEKHALKARIEKRVTMSPVAIGDVLQRLKGDGDIEYMRVRVSGVFDHDKERYYFAQFNGVKGWHVYTPLRLKDGAVLFVNRGFVSDAVKLPGARQAGQVKGETIVTGLVRKPGRKGYFTPENDIAGNSWYWRDLDNMFASVYDTQVDGIDAGEKSKFKVIPFFVEADDSAISGGWPKAGVTRVTLRDNHLEYALTWYGLAIALIAVYGFFLRNWLKQGRP